MDWNKFIRGNTIVYSLDIEEAEQMKQYQNGSMGVFYPIKTVDPHSTVKYNKLHLTTHAYRCK